MPSTVKKKRWITIGEFTLWFIDEVETTESLKNAEDFINNTGIVSWLDKLKSIFFSKKIAQNTVSVLWEAERIISESWCTDRKEIPMKTSISIIENAWLEDDISLQNKRSAMLANAVIDKVEIKSQYPEILKQLSLLEVNLLDQLFFILQNKDLKKWWVKSSVIKNKFSLWENEFDEVIDNLLRLSLIFTWDWIDESAQDKSIVAEHMKRGLICLTRLWYNFIRSCRFEGSVKIEIN